MKTILLFLNRSFSKLVFYIGIFLIISLSILLVFLVYQLVFNLQGLELGAFIVIFLCIVVPPIIITLSIITALFRDKEVYFTDLRLYKKVMAIGFIIPTYSFFLWNILWRVVVLFNEVFWRMLS